ncbi:MAG: protoglobin domain-containing protein [bacterium]
MAGDTPEADIRRRMALLGLDEAGYGRLAPLAERIASQGPAAMDPFFERIARLPELGNLFAEEGARAQAREALHRAVLRALRGPAAGSGGEEAQVSLGLSPGAYAAVFALVEQTLAAELARLHGDGGEEDLLPALEALRKALSLDLQLSLDALPERGAERAREAEEGSRLKTLFLALLSRELGAPSAFLRSKVEEMAQEADPWRLRELAGEMVESVYRIDRLARDVADTAALESRALDLQDETVDLSSLVSGRISKRIRRLRKFRFQPEVPSGPLLLRADKNRLSLLVDDLLDAAVNLTPGGGTILVRLAREGEEAVFSTLNRSARAQEERIGAFPDWLQEEPEEGGFAGSGVALYRASRTAQLYGGRLEFSASPEEGAAFTVRLPISLEEEPS